MIVAKLLHKSPDTINALSISLLIMLVYNPFELLDTGLILSYGGTIGILIFAKYGRKIKNYILKMIVVSLSANVILMPIIAYLFCTFHPLFFLSAIFATPLFEAIILLGFTFLLLFQPMCTLLKIPLELCTSLFIKTAQITSKLPLAQINVARPSIAEIIIFYIIIFLSLVPRIKLPKKKMIAILLCLILTLRIPSILPSTFHIYFIDVGQGDCTLVKTVNNKTIMIDSGGQEDLEEYDVGKSVLVPYLLARGIIKLDYIMVSHFHADHCNRFYWDNERNKSWNIANG